MDVTALDGRTFERFVAAGTYFLRKYRSVLDDLNVFPVPDGDTGSNMYLTARAALAEAKRKRGEPLSAVAAAAAAGSLLGARGNSGVILSQMLRGFAHNVRHRPHVDSLDLAIAMRAAVGTARSSLQRPVEGTMISVAGAAADAAYSSAQRETDLVRVASDIVRAAADALDRTPDQLPALRDAGVVDSGGAGIVYFLEGILRFLPEATTHATAFPRRPERKNIFTSRQTVSVHRFCTEFVLEDAKEGAGTLREVLERHGDSLIVAGTVPTLKVHLHAANPRAALESAASYGRVSREKIEDMVLQHHLLVVDAPARKFGVVAVVPGEGFARMARELGADVAVVAQSTAPSVRDLVVAANACMTNRVYLLANDPNVTAAAHEAASRAQRDVTVIPTPHVCAGLAVLLSLGSAQEAPKDTEALLSASAIDVASVFFADGSAQRNGGVRQRAVASIAGRLVPARTLRAAVMSAARELAPDGEGLLTVYYGGSRKERDAKDVAATLRHALPAAEVEYYYGGQRAVEYLVSHER